MDLLARRDHFRLTSFPRKRESRRFTNGSGLDPRFRGDDESLMYRQQRRRHQAVLGNMTRRLAPMLLAFTCVTLPRIALGICVCRTDSVQEQISEADIIFRGELRSLSEDWEGCGSTGTWNYAMEAFEVFKGDDVVKRVNIRSPPPGNDTCGVPVQREGEFLIYAKDVDNIDEYLSDICMGTKSIDDAAVDLALLGSGAPPQESGCAALPMNGLALWGLIGLLLRRRRRQAAQLE